MSDTFLNLVTLAHVDGMGMIALSVVTGVLGFLLGRGSALLKRSDDTPRIEAKPADDGPAA